MSVIIGGADRQYVESVARTHDEGTCTLGIDDIIRAAVPKRVSAATRTAKKIRFTSADGKVIYTITAQLGSTGSDVWLQYANLGKLIELPSRKGGSYRSPRDLGGYEFLKMCEDLSFGSFEVEGPTGVQNLLCCAQEVAGEQGLVIVPSQGIDISEAVAAWNGSEGFTWAWHRIHEALRDIEWLGSSKNRTRVNPGLAVPFWDMCDCCGKALYPADFRPEGIPAPRLRSGEIQVCTVCQRPVCGDCSLKCGRCHQRICAYCLASVGAAVGIPTVKKAWNKRGAVLPDNAACWGGAQHLMCLRCGDAMVSDVSDELSGMPSEAEARAEIHKRVLDDALLYAQQGTTSRWDVFPPTWDSINPVVK